MVKCFPRYLITTAKHAVKIEPSKYLGKFLPICLILPCAKDPNIPFLEVEWLKKKCMVMYQYPTCDMHFVHLKR